MDNILLAFVFAFLICGMTATKEDCWIPCNNIQGGSCVSIHCKTDLRATFECHLISTILSSSSKVPTKLQTCIAPSEVPGMPQFCSNLLNNGSMILENLHKEMTPQPTKQVYTDDVVTTVDRADCIPVAILAGVAVGCFTSGAIVMWLFLAILWSKKACCCKEPSKERNITDSQTQAAPTVRRHEIPPSRMISISHQRLLSTTSIDSGMSSTNIVPTLSPPALSVSPVVETREETQTAEPQAFRGARSDYTSLHRDTRFLCSTDESQESSQNSDYASLMMREASDMSPADINPYQKLQGTENIKIDQSENVVESHQLAGQPARNPRVSYPSVSRSTKSDTHDYESIFNECGATPADVSCTEYGSRRGSDGDYHEYHVCGASNSLEKHEYFVLDKQVNDYFELEKES